MTQRKGKTERYQAARFNRNWWCVRLILIFHLILSLFVRSYWCWLNGAIVSVDRLNMLWRETSIECRLRIIVNVPMTFCFSATSHLTFDSTIDDWIQSKSTVAVIVDIRGYIECLFIIIIVGRVRARLHRYREHTPHRTARVMRVTCNVNPINSNVWFSLFIFFASTLDRRIQIKWRYRPQRPIRILHDKIDNFSTKKPVIWYCSVSKCLSLGHLFGVRVWVCIVMCGYTEHICATQQCIPFIYLFSVSPVIYSRIERVPKSTLIMYLLSHVYWQLLYRTVFPNYQSV